MERLTKRTADGKVAYAPLQAGECVDTIDLLRVWGGRLAAYEDTGLEPYEIEFYREAQDHTESMSPKRFIEIAQAEKDGRLVVLPVPVGKDKLAYRLTDPDMGSPRIVSIECDRLDSLEIWPSNEVVVEVDGWEIGQSDIGKTVFLTREEAEAALKKMEADDETD